MKVTAIDHVFQDIYVDVKKMVQERNEQLDEKKINSFRSDKIQQYLVIVEEIQCSVKKFVPKTADNFLQLCFSDDIVSYVL